MSNIINPPYPIFTDIDGSPLNEGFIYIGENLQDPISNPVSVYWDVGLTEIAEQPISIKNGYIVRNGVNSTIFTMSNKFSVIAKNKYGTEIYGNLSFEQFINNSEAQSLINTSITPVQQSIDDEIIRATSSETLLSSAINTEINRATSAEAAIQAQINGLGGGASFGYTSYADMVADAASIPANSVVTVGGDPDPLKDGMYIYDGSVFSLSPYDPLTQAKTYTDTKVDSIIIETDNNVPPVPIVDVDGWFYGGFYEDGSMETPLFNISNYYLDGFIIIDEDGWILLEQNTSSNAVKDWSQKKILLFGDSITETSNVEAGIYDSLAYRQNWLLYAFAMLEIQSFQNFARSGASYREYAGQLDWQKISHQIGVAIGTGFTPDIVVIACGTNDGVSNLGDYDTAMSKNIVDLDMSLTAEALRKNLYNISQAYPNAKLFSCLPLQRADVETSTRQPLLDLIRKMSGRYGFTVIDCHNETGIVKDFEIWGSSGRDLSDGLHPKTSGQIKQAKNIAANIKSNYQLQV